MKTYLEPREIERIERAAECLRDRLLFRLLFRLGCRISEVLGIKVNDIDLKQGMVTIEHLKVRINLSCPQCDAQLGKAHHFCPVCGLKVEQVVSQEKERRRYRSLPVDEGTLAILIEYISRGGAVTKQGRRFIFGISRHRAWQIVKESAEKAGLSKLVNPETGRVHNVSPHRLRDAFAVHAVKLNDSGDGLR